MALPRDWDPVKACTALAAERDTMDNTPEEQAKQVLRENVSIAAYSIVQLAQYAGSETTRLAASKYICDVVIGKDGKGVDALDILVNQLLGNN